ncbi:unnamed protein product [Haemonchus placei]|uniref:Uncharacterized protein n=1 Tax=Haemonchus placei TaxID=6290 RepID=A0A3P7XT40_HAEPC|nr:unnamed protein product [Haemonchus placei]
MFCFLDSYDFCRTATPKDSRLKQFALREKRENWACGRGHQLTRSSSYCGASIGSS